MDHLVLHENTRVQAGQFIANPSQALLLAGPDGIGKTALAEALVCALLELEQAQLAGYPHFLRIAPAGTSISIDAIRNLQRFLQLKTVGTHLLRRALIIEHAQALTTEAQNAYLKLLEEPPADTLMILTVNSPRALLPTIRSRVQVIHVSAPTEAQVQKLLQHFEKDEATKRQAYFLSGGLPGLLTALLAGDEAHPLLGYVATAKDILQKSTFERLAMADALSKQKDTARGVLDALDRIAQSALASAAAKEDSARIAQWHRIRKLTAEANHSLSASVNAKLALTNLFLHL